MNHIGSVFLYLIATLWLIKKRKMSSKFNTLSIIIFLLAAIFSIVEGITPIQKYLETIDNQTTLVLLFVGIVLSMTIIPLIFCIIIWRGTDWIIQIFYKKHLTLTVLSSSKLYLGGELLMEVKVSGFFAHGFFNIKIRSPYDEEIITTSRYDDVKKRGKLRGQFKEQNMKLKSHIPKTFSSGDYDVVVELCDVISWLFSLRTIRKIKIEKLRITINES